MKKSTFLLIIATILLSFQSFSQDTITRASVSHKGNRPPNRIKPGFYIKLGPTIPIGSFASGKTLKTPKLADSSLSSHYPSTYLPAKMGGAMDMGFLIYLGPAFANNHIRLGIDATFLSFWFNSIKSDTMTGSKSQYWYYFVGQKFGPVISVCPIDRLVIDLSYKLNAYLAYNHHSIDNKMKDEWGYNLTQNEISINIRYSIMLFSFQYNFGKIKFNDLDSAKPNHYLDNSTYRIMIGFKF